MMVDEVSDRAGGAERLAARLAAELSRERYDITLCATRGIDGSLGEELDAADLRLLALERTGRFDLVPLARLARFLRSERIDILHAHKFGSNFWGTLIGRLCRVPILIAHEHTWSYEGNPLRKFLDGRVIGRLATRFVAVSSADRKRMIEIEHVPAEKVTVIPTAFIPRPSGGGGDLRAELGIPDGVPVIGTVARLRPQKALTVLIEAFAELAGSHPSCRLVIVGDGECRGKLEMAAQSAGVLERVHFPGQRTDIDTVLEAFDIAAMSSDFEGLPLFVFECMAHRVPLVATDVGGLRDAVDNGRTGVLVPPRDPAALAEALGRLVDDDELRRGLAEAAAERMGDFTMERAVQRVGELYDRLLSEAGRGSTRVS